MRHRVALLLVCSAGPLSAQQASRLAQSVDAQVARVMPQVIAWRRDIHQHPELGNREFRTAKLIADQLTALGLEVRREVGKTGVVALLKGGKP